MSSVAGNQTCDITTENVVQVLAAAGLGHVGAAAQVQRASLEGYRAMEGFQVTCNYTASLTCCAVETAEVCQGQAKPLMRPRVRMYLQATLILHDTQMCCRH